MTLFSPHYLRQGVVKSSVCTRLLPRQSGCFALLPLCQCCQFQIARVLFQFSFPNYKISQHHLCAKHLVLLMRNQSAYYSEKPPYFLSLFFSLFRTSIFFAITFSTPGNKTPVPFIEMLDYSWRQFYRTEEKDRSMELDINKAQIYKLKDCGSNCQEESHEEGGQRIESYVMYSQLLKYANI